MRRSSVALAGQPRPFGSMTGVAVPEGAQAEPMYVRSPVGVPRPPPRVLASASRSGVILVVGAPCVVGRCEELERERSAVAAARAFEWWCCIIDADAEAEGEMDELLACA